SVNSSSSPAGWGRWPPHPSGVPSYLRGPGPTYYPRAGQFSLRKPSTVAQRMNTLRRSITCMLILLFAAASGAAAQDRTPCSVAQPGKLVLYGDVSAPIVLTEADLLAMPQVTVEETPHGGESRRSEERRVG